MTLASVTKAQSIEPYLLDAEKHRRASCGNNPSVLADIYQEDTHIVIWERALPATLRESVAQFVCANPTFQTSFTVTPRCALASLRKTFAGSGQAELSENVASLIQMFCDLFELERAGVRLTTLGRAMCPRFHVDKVPCRLLTTYHGVATEWMPHQAIDRSMLGAAGHGLSDDDSGLLKNRHDIQQLNCGDVALLKGELWEGNENAGLVHRSPAVLTNEHRLLLTLDFCT